MRPLLRYHGGKWQLGPWILRQLPNHRVYVEPFGGGGSVLLQKPRSYAEIYNDIDGEVVNLFRVTRDQGAELSRRLVLTPFARDEFIEAAQPSADPIERARRTLIRSFMGFGSNATSGASTSFRAASNRSGTTPAHDWKTFPQALPAIIERLRGVVIENREGMDVMRQHDSPSTLHYVDPPYVWSTRRRNQSYRHEMTDDNHRALAQCLHGLQGFVVLSGYRCELYEDMYRGWRCIERHALADGARARMEVLWLSPNVPGTDLFYDDKSKSVTKL